MSARILIVEDNRTNMELMSYLLSAYGYELTTAGNGREGLEQALGGSFDLIICDLEMPELNGYQFAQQLKTRKDSWPVPLIAVTAYAMVGDRDKVLRSGFDGYIPKPISPETFVQQVEKFLPPHRRSGRTPEPAEETPVTTVRQRATSAVVLVVDDSPVNLALIQSTLEPSGYRVISAGSVREAMDEAGRHRFDLILSDLHMPVESGFEFLKQVKADARLKSIPFVLCTGSHLEAGDESHEHAMRLGAEKYITRPIEPGALLTLVDSLIQGRTKGAYGHSISR